VSTRTRIGFIGLGAMGAPISVALLEAGNDLVVYDPNPEAVTRAVGAGAVACASVLEVADAAELVFASLPTPDVVREAVAGDEGVFAGSRVRTFVDLSTTGAAVTEELARSAQERGIDYLDSPVSGGVVGAEARTLAVMASGAEETFERILPLLETFGGSVFHVGDRPGQGQIAKLLNNLLSATALVITAEAASVAARAELDLTTLLEVFSAGSGRNSATAEKFPKHVLTRGFGSGFRLELMTKDVELCTAEARRHRVPLLVGGLVQQLWTLAAEQLDDDADHTEIVRVFEEWSGVTFVQSAGGRR
jgi:3-hydroxyisobutyrate dehydrogenase-like beta-hydroxyacid dehydrogenase